MFTAGHLHRDNNDRPEHMRLLPPFSVDFYYEVRKDPEQGPMLHMRLVGEVDGKHFEEEFELHRDVAFNFASVATRIAARHGLPPQRQPGDARPRRIRQGIRRHPQQTQRPTGRAGKSRPHPMT